MHASFCLTALLLLFTSMFSDCFRPQEMNFVITLLNGILTVIVKDIPLKTFFALVLAQGAHYDFSVSLQSCGWDLMWHFFLRKVNWSFYWINVYQKTFIVLNRILAIIVKDTAKIHSSKQFVFVFAERVHHASTAGFPLSRYFTCVNGRDR